MICYIHFILLLIVITYYIIIYLWIRYNKFIIWYNQRISSKLFFNFYSLHTIDFKILFSYTLEKIFVMIIYISMLYLKIYFNIYHFIFCKIWNIIIWVGNIYFQNYIFGHEKFRKLNKLFFSLENYMIFFLIFSILK